MGFGHFGWKIILRCRICQKLLTLNICIIWLFSFAILLFDKLPAFDSVLVFQLILHQSFVSLDMLDDVSNTWHSNDAFIVVVNCRWCTRCAGHMSARNHHSLPGNVEQWRQRAHSRPHRRQFSTHLRSEHLAKESSENSAHQSAQPHDFQRAGGRIGRLAAFEHHICSKKSQG